MQPVSVNRFRPSTWEFAATSVYWDAHYQAGLFFLSYAIGVWDSTPRAEQRPHLLPALRDVRARFAIHSRTTFQPCLSRNHESSFSHFSFWFPARLTSRNVSRSRVTSTSVGNPVHRYVSVARRLPQTTSFFTLLCSVIYGSGLSASSAYVGSSRRARNIFFLPVGPAQEHNSDRASLSPGAAGGGHKDARFPQQGQIVTGRFGFSHEKTVRGNRDGEGTLPHAYPPVFVGGHRRQRRGSFWEGVCEA